MLLTPLYLCRITEIRRTVNKIMPNAVKLALGKSFCPLTLSVIFSTHALLAPKQFDFIFKSGEGDEILLVEMFGYRRFVLNVHWKRRITVRAACQRVSWSF